MLLLLLLLLLQFFLPLAEPSEPPDFGCAETNGAAVQLYGSCGLQDRGRQLYVASRTGSHAFPRDLRGSHPRDHGGNGETVEERVAPGQGYAAQREGFGKPTTRGFNDLQIKWEYKSSCVNDTCCYCGKSEQELRGRLFGLIM